MQSTSKKIEFIVGWFRAEKSRLSFKDQLRLVRAWTDICINAEEYEMASALQEERLYIIQARLKEKRKGRTIKELIRNFFIKLKRKLRKT